MSQLLSMVREEQVDTPLGMFGTEDSGSELRLFLSLNFAKSASDADILEIVHNFVADHSGWWQAETKIPDRAPEPVANSPIQGYPFPKEETAPEFEFVYIIKCGPTYKIGRTRDLDRRLADWSPTPAYPIEVKLVIKAKDSRQAEKDLHNHFADKRLRGEWFELTELDVEYVRSLFLDSLA